MARINSAGSTITVKTNIGPRGPQGEKGDPGSLDNNSGFTAGGDVTISGSIQISGSIIPNVSDNDNFTSSFDLGSETAAWKDIYVSEGSIVYVSGSSRSRFSKQDVDDLKSGKSIARNSSGIRLENVQKHPEDDTTFVKMKPTVKGRVDHVISGKTLIKLQTGSMTIGDTTSPNTPVTMSGPVLVDGPGSSSIQVGQTIGNNDDVTTITGGFALGDLLNVLTAFGATNVPTGSLGDYNFDGAVNMGDILFVLSGYNNPQFFCKDIIVPAGTNQQLIGPEVEICENKTITVEENAFLTVTL